MNHWKKKVKFWICIIFMAVMPVLTGVACSDANENGYADDIRAADSVKSSGDCGLLGALEGSCQ